MLNRVLCVKALKQQILIENKNYAKDICKANINKRGAATFTTSKNIATVFLTESGCIFVNFV